MTTKRGKRKSKVKVNPTVRLTTLVKIQHYPDTEDLSEYIEKANKLKEEEPTKYLWR